MADERDATTREAVIVDTFVHLSDTLVDDYDVIEFLHYLTERTVELGDVDEAAVMLASPTGHLQAVAASTERLRLLELFELQNRDGPCLDAFRQGTVVDSEDLLFDFDRWPTFAPRAVDVGFRSVYSIPLKLRSQVIGALNLLRIESGRLDERDAMLLGAMADIATVGVLQERFATASTATATGLQIALNSRIRIEQAKGILAERHDISVDRAFETLRTHARRHGERLTEVALDVVQRHIDIDPTVQ